MGTSKKFKVKFRAWNGEEMISPDYVTRDGVGWWKENSIPTTSEIVMLSSGLKDINGVVIFDQDIMEKTLPNGKVVVRYIRLQNGGFHECKSRSSPLRGSSGRKPSTALFAQKIWMGKMRVIGNIHANPEMLPIATTEKTSKKKKKTMKQLSGYDVTMGQILKKKKVN